MTQQIIDALRVIVFTQHIREYLELYDPQALKQAMGALSTNANIEAELANAREANTHEGAFGEYNRSIDELMGRNASHLPLADADARAEWSIDAQMAERAHDGHWWGGNPHAVEAPGHFPEDAEPVGTPEASSIQLELEDEAGNVDLCECEPAPSTRVIRVIRRVKQVAQYEPGDSIIYRAQYSYACGHHD